VRREHGADLGRRRRAGAQPPAPAGRGVLGRSRPAAAPDHGGPGGKALASEPWVSELRAAEDELRAGERAELEDGRAPLHPMRLYAELAGMLDRDAIVIGDGGDYVSYAGKVVDSYRPGCWLDPGPFGCLGTGPGYALAAKLA